MVDSEHLDGAGLLPSVPTTTHHQTLTSEHGGQMSTIVQDRLHIPMDALSELCQQYFVRELELFGSVLRDDFRDDSDIDILVEFEPDAPIGLIEYVRLQRELATLLGRSVDLVEKAGLKPLIRDHIIASARPLYASSK